MILSVLRGEEKKKKGRKKARRGMRQVKKGGVFERVARYLQSKTIGKE